MGDQILFDEGKRELFLPSTNYKKLVRRLKATYSVQSNTELLTLERLKGVHCLVLASPTESLSASEVAVLHTFVDGGGSLVVLSGEGGPAAVESNLNDVVSKCVGCALAAPAPPLPPLPPHTAPPLLTHPLQVWHHHQR
jgi:hypothetical protein